VHADLRLVELAIKGLEAERARIEQELSQLRKGGRATARSLAIAAGASRPRRRMSAAARRKISEAMKRSHAERKRAAVAASKK